MSEEKKTNALGKHDPNKPRRHLSAMEKNETPMADASMSTVLKRLEDNLQSVASQHEIPEAEFDDILLKLRKERSADWARVRSVAWRPRAPPCLAHPALPTLPCPPSSLWCCLLHCPDAR